MENYTLEEVIDAINSELTEAYYEASKEYKYAKGIMKLEKLVDKAYSAIKEGETAKAKKLVDKTNERRNKLREKYGYYNDYFGGTMTPKEEEKLKKGIDKLKKESVSNIYEAYCDDIIDAETAMDMILTIEASE